MAVNLGLLMVVGVLAACGAYLLMERSLVRMLFGLLLVGNAINLLIVTVSGGLGNPPILHHTSQARAGDADPLAQAMILTAIVITMGVAAFVLSLVYRLFVLNSAEDDEVSDDPEDRKIVGSSLANAPDRDRSDDPTTGADTTAGDLFDDSGTPLTPEQFAEAHRQAIEADLMPRDADIVAALTGDEPDSAIDASTSDTSEATTDASADDTEEHPL